jgi:hypothetical protein
MTRGVLCATSPDGKAIFRHDGGGSWTHIDSATVPYKHFVGTPAGLVASYDFYGIHGKLYQPAPQRWIDLFGNTLDTANDDGIYAGTRHGLYRLNDRRDAIRRFNVYGGGTDRWTTVGGPAGNIFGGGWGLLAVDPAGTNVTRFRPDSGTWKLIATGGGPQQYAVTTETAYRLAGNRLDRYSGDGQWPNMDAPPLTSIVAGVWGLVGIHAESGDLYQYLNVPEPHGPIDQWKKIGGPGSMFAMGESTVYGLTPNREAVYEYQPGTKTWTAIGGPAKEIAYCGGVDPLP